MIDEKALEEAASIFQRGTTLTSLEGSFFSLGTRFGAHWQAQQNEALALLQKRGGE